MAKKCVVLSIDGGGIRGIVPCVILQELERRLAKKRKTKPLSGYFDLIAGTSTGGIIAAGLVCPHPDDHKKPAMDAGGLLALYKEKGRDIFSRDVFRRLRENILDPRSIWQEKYDADALQRELISRCGTWKLSNGLTHVMLTAYDIENRCTVHMRNTMRPDGTRPDDYYFWQACRATSAAPTYFEPARVEMFSSKGQQHNQVLTLIDGGVYANDPVMSALAEAIRLGHDLDDIYVVSVGTGYQTRPFWFRDVRNWGPISWISPSAGAPIISILMHGQAHAASFQADVLLNQRTDKKQRYFRFDAALNIGNDDMDDASETNILALETLARQMIERDSAQLDAIVELL